MESGRRLCIGGWILAVVILFGVNGFALISLFSPPLVGRSKETRLASQKWIRLENKLSLILEESFDKTDLEAIIDRFSPVLNVIKQQTLQPQAAKSESEAELEIQPPILTGIMKISDAHGNHHWFALIEGKRLMENDSVRGFFIQKITDQGVVLSRDGKVWFVPAPEVHFSLDREG